MASGHPYGCVLAAIKRFHFYDMKYCYNCDRVTIGEPLFCNFCGRSYDVKLCPRLHVNGRNTRVCSNCSSSELTTPQPRVPPWAKILLFLLTLIPGLILVVISIGLVAFFVNRFLFSHDMLMGLAAIDFVRWVRSGGAGRRFRFISAKVFIDGCRHPGSSMSC